MPRARAHRAGAAAGGAAAGPQRARNVRGAFALRAPTSPARAVALVDDVMTTGATLAEAAAHAAPAGAARVECWVVARTLPPAQPDDRRTGPNAAATS